MSHEPFNETIWQKLINDTLSTCIAEDVDTPQQELLILEQPAPLQSGLEAICT